MKQPRSSGAHGDTLADAGPAIKHHLTLDEWLERIRSGYSHRNFVDFQFLCDAYYDLFVSKITTYSASDITLLLERFLVSRESLGSDSISLSMLMEARVANPKRYQELVKHSYYRRLETSVSSGSSGGPWQGITWITDLLPDSPKQALAVLDAYAFVHVPLLPDGRLHGLSDSMGIIRAYYIGRPDSQPERLDYLKQLESRDFEHLVEALFFALGYKTTLTPRAKDGGRDIIASRAQPGQAEQVYVECKRYSGNIGVQAIRALLGVVVDGKVNRGVLATTGRFTADARAFGLKNPRLELLHGGNLIPLLNEHLGANWPTRIDRIILESKRRSASHS